MVPRSASLEALPGPLRGRFEARASGGEHGCDTDPLTICALLRGARGGWVAGRARVVDT